MASYASSRGGGRRRGGGYDWTVHLRGGGRGGGYGGGRGRHGDSRRGKGRSGPSGSNGPVQPASKLSSILQQIDGKSYGAYKDLYGTFDFDSEYTLTFDHVQSDPFASPTRAHISITNPGFSLDCFTNKIRRVAAADFFTRMFWQTCHKAGGDQGHSAGGSGGYHGEKGGAVTIDRPGQHVVERTSVVCAIDGSLQVRFTLSMPARGRSVLGQKAYGILFELLPQVVKSSLLRKNYSTPQQHLLQQHINSVEDQEYLRSQLPALGLAAFVRNGALLPRKSGADDAPLDAAGVVLFKSPGGMEVTVELLHGGSVTGMGVRRGVTLICGGGFHGKSTLLNAIETGVYNRLVGDGREFVCSDPTSSKIRAEDGRSVCGVDISPFINNLPQGKSTKKFSSADASGSTSQAAAIVEALEIGATTLLIDEDTAATNFMVRDARMQTLIPSDPITPFIHRVRQLWETHGISSILVVGGCGDYFEVADQIVVMENYTPTDATERAKAIITETRSRGDTYPSIDPFMIGPPRILARSTLQPGGKVVGRRLNCLTFGDDIDLGSVEQLVETSQVRAIGDIMLWMGRKVCDGSASLSGALEVVEKEIERNGLDAIAQYQFAGDLARPRRGEIVAAINRYRELCLA